MITAPIGPDQIVGDPFRNARQSGRADPESGCRGRHHTVEQRRVTPPQRLAAPAQQQKLHELLSSREEVKAGRTAAALPSWSAQSPQNTHETDPSDRHCRRLASQAASAGLTGGPAQGAATDHVPC